MTQLVAAPKPVVAGRTAPKPGLTTYVWLVWRQHGGLVVSACVLTLLVCTALLFAGPMLAVVHCTGSPYDLTVGGPSAADSCGNAAASNTHLYTVSLWLVRATVYAPVLFGAFFGAPLASREYEAGTHELAWGQGISARRWLRGKLLVLGSLAALLCLAMWACARPVSEAMSRLAPWEFGGRFGWESFATLVPMTVAYAAAALAIGVFCSVALRKTLPAMACAAALCLGLGVGTADLLRPHYAPAEIAHGAIGGDVFTVTGDPLVVAAGWASAQGKPVKGYPGACDPDSLACLHAHGIYSRFISYQPGSREGEFQLLEAALTLLVAAGLGSLAVSRTSRGFGVAR